MTVTKVHKDTETLTLTVTSEFDAPPERVWQLWADRGQLEQWWGPPTYPATFTRHELWPGGRVEYHMTGPEGDQPRGYWEVVEVEEPRWLRFEDGFLSADGTENGDFPVITFRMSIEPIEGGRSRMTIDNEFASAESMEQMLAMGMEEGLTAAVGQIDSLLAAEAVDPIQS